MLAFLFVQHTMGTLRSYLLGGRDGFLLLFPSDRICVETAMKTEGEDEQPGCGRELGLGCGERKRT